MKILNKNSNKNINFNFTNNNVFIINNLDVINDLELALSLSFLNKFSSPDYEIKMQENDIMIDKLTTKLIKVPNFIDFTKSICGGSKTILKELLNLCITYDAFSSQSLSTLFGFINTIDLTELNIIENLITNLESKLGLKITIEIQDQIINYICDQTILKLQNIDENETNTYLNQNKLRIIYIEILKNLLIIDDKNLHFLFVNPFFGLNYIEIKEFFDDIKELKNFTIVSDKFIYENDLNLENLKIWIDNKFLDLSFIIDNLKFYMNFSNCTLENDFYNELLLNTKNLISSYNSKNLEINYPVFHYLLNL
ncbi:hypothetical protein [Spiroplasma tabanidicola]|uniref:Uncharacterized protein n=1 Tax=Spiroplasma tabanidicola TaxID=324079 RepID=A0A6I6CCU7_9MOLU|nr:hypothetical protein [Spiroplasma tabanidicola]QGS51962.1 hypothetical protein STABA_v1c05990 [Spiroplasma tabanidicola]